MADNFYTINVIPNLRLGLSAGATLSDNAGRQSRKIELQATAGIEAAGNWETAGSKEVILKGPADVIGIRESEIARCMPVAGSNDFPYNFFPFIEFNEPDFLWRYSVPTTTSKEKMHPWLALVVLENNGSFSMKQVSLAKGWTITRLTVNDGKILPDISNLWAWAHVHFLGDVNSSKDCENRLRNFPDTNCCRLICPVQLSGGKPYTAFLVPAYEAGRRAALGEDVEVNLKDNLKPWNAVAGKAFDLPVFYQWSFTASEYGEFEELVKKIKKPGQVDALTGMKVDLSENGLISTAALLKDTNTNAAVFNFQAALVPVTSTNPDTAVLNKFKEEMQKQLVEQIPTDDEDPLVTIPVYGQSFSNDLAADLNNPDSWLSELNSHPAYRIAAAAGAQIVQQNQDEYIAMYMEHINTVAELTEKIRLAEMSASIEASMHKQHLRKLPAERRVFVALQQNDLEANWELDESGLPKGSTTLRSRKYFGNNAIKRFAPDAVTEQKKFLKAHIELRMTGRTTANVAPALQPNAKSTLRADIVDMKPVDVATLAEVIYRPEKALDMIEAKLVKVGGTTGSKIREISGISIKDPKLLLSLINRNPSLLKQIMTENTYTVRGRGTFELTTAKGILVSGTITRKSTGSSKLQALYDELNKIEIPYTTSTLLRLYSKDLMMIGMDALTINSAIMMKPNQSYIESFMMGMNHEMSKILLWREICLPPKLSLFRHFWPSIFGSSQADYDDIMPLSQWKGTDRLGTHSASGSPQPETILLIKGDLVKCFPDLDIIAVQVQPNGTVNNDTWQSVLMNRENDTNFEVKMPMFLDKVAHDTLLIGFGELQKGKSYFVFTEPMCLPRFGLDLIKITDDDDLTWSQVKIDRNWVMSFNDYSDSANIVPDILQLPAQVVVPANYFII